MRQTLFKKLRPALATGALALLLSFLTACAGTDITTDNAAIAKTAQDTAETISALEKTTALFSANNEIILAGIEQYSGSPYIELYGNVPLFLDKELTTTSYEYYSDLDSLGRCGMACACIGQDLMPTEERGLIGKIKPSGWHTVKYDIVDDNYLYNRCHLIGYQLTAENAEEKNLITGTRYLNIQGMLPFENMVEDYVKGTGNHVMYKVIPLYDGDNLIASGVIMTAKSVEDDGDGISFCVFCYNVQPGINIDYATGESRLEDVSAQEEITTEAITDTTEAPTAGAPDPTYVVNTNSKKFHDPDCAGVETLKDANRWDFYGTRDELMNAGYVPCKRCNP